MRWTRPETGEKRQRTFWALFPVRIGLETRWLERVTVEYLYERTPSSDGWYAQRFVDSEDGEREEAECYEDAGTELGRPRAWSIVEHACHAPEDVFIKNWSALTTPAQEIFRDGFPGYRSGIPGPRCAQCKYSTPTELIWSLRQGVYVTTAGKEREREE